jgi:hypothetical protein
MLKQDIGGEREVSDDAAGLKVPLGITEGARGVSFQLFKSPHGLSEQEPTEEACRQCTYLLCPAHDASPAFISDVSQQTPPRADIARKYDGQRMCSRLTFIFQLLDSPMQLPMAFPPRCAKLGLGLGNTVPQASDFIIRHVFHEERGNVSADHLRSPRWDSNYLPPSYDEGGGIFPRLPQSVLNVLLVQVLGYLLRTFQSNNCQRRAKLHHWAAVKVPH